MQICKPQDRINTEQLNQIDMFQLVLFFLYTSGDYSIQTQYYVYDVGDFIADIGGYMVG